MSDDFKDLSMAELFHMEAESQIGVLTTGLLALEKGQGGAEQLEEMMRAAHSLKGAARIVGLNAGVAVAHVMEDAFVAAQEGKIQLVQSHIDQLLIGVDLIEQLAAASDDEMANWEKTNGEKIDSFKAGLKAALAGETVPTPVVATPEPTPESAPTPVQEMSEKEAEKEEAPKLETTRAAAAADSRFLRVTADNLNRLLGLAGESLVESRRLRRFGTSVERMKRLHVGLAGSLDQLRAEIEAGETPERLVGMLTETQRQLSGLRDSLDERIDEFDTHDRRASNLAHRLYGEALAVRMRPFADGIGGFPRMVRDVARELGKEVQFEVIGENTQVDRDILDKLEAPLGHLLRNAVDHGLESPADRVAAGKPAAGTVTLEARHSAGKLLITVSDNGHGMDIERLRATVIKKNLVTAEMAPSLSEAELLEFLFLPSFTMKDIVTDISGRGVGLDAVQSMLKAVRGSIRVTSIPGQGMKFALQLPLTLSVARALLVRVAGEPYAFPLGFIARTLRLSEKDVASTEGRQHFNMDGERVGLIAAHEVLGGAAQKHEGDLSVVVIGESDNRYGVVVEEFLGEHELVVQPLDPRLGKVPDIAAGALMEDGAPVLIIDVEDLAHSIEKIIATGTRPSSVSSDVGGATSASRKNVLVVDDSIAVRELERKLLESKGYRVEVAKDGMDGWNAVRSGNFDLVVSDVDMPRLDGIELTKLIKRDPRLREMPVMIVSYKDREEDRRRGLDAGADYYLTKASFHDTTMIDAVRDLIGDAEETGG